MMQRLNDQIGRCTSRKLLLPCDQIVIANGKGLEHRHHDKGVDFNLFGTFLDPERLDLMPTKPRRSISAMIMAMGD
jgi:hypothetical protein